MKMQNYFLIMFFIFTGVSYEYITLSFLPNLSIIAFFIKHKLISESFNVSLEPGRAISLWMGWIGLILMIVMNIYTLRKKVSFMQHWGKLSNWLNFHIFCGLMGPMFIMFHCQLKARGIVGISFWSMVISFSSGIIGRYFYTQVLLAQNDFELSSQKRLKQLKDYLNQFNIELDEVMQTKVLQKAYSYVGIPKNIEDLNPISALYYSAVGDFRLSMNLPAKPKEWPELTRFLISEVAVFKRKAIFIESFQKLMGYWHTFHFPFAIFMYIAAFIHVVTALLLGV